MSLDQLIYEKIPSLSAGQRKVAEYILNNKDEFSYATQIGRASCRERV